MRRPILPPLFLLSLFLSGLHFPAPAVAAPTDDGAEQARISAELYEHKALEHFYSAEFREAEEQYRKAIALQPENPLYWNGLADCYLFQLLLAAGRLDSQFYTAANEFLNPTPTAPDAVVVKAFWEALGRARSLGEKRVRANASDAQAHYALAVSYAIESHYHLNLTRKPLDALRSGDKSRDAAQRARQLDSKNSDPNLILGAYEYAIGSVPGAFRWLLLLSGHSGSKTRGVELLQDAMLHGKRTSTAALALLAVMYGREKLFVYSREMFQHLLRFFPRNYLYEMEIARTYQREGNLGAAIEVCKNVARKYETRAPGFERVDPVKLYFQIATLVEEHGRPDDAMEFFQKVISKKPEGVLHAQSYLRMGEYYRARKERERARTMFENARRLPFPEIQRQAVAGLRRL
ncbi:MAG: tetratricopeptide repeat protein [Acidobacteria bacterium]|nr:tetratricopeptide repeat protein [Acidobacteriota bacterium]